MKNQSIADNERKIFSTNLNIIMAQKGIAQSDIVTAFGITASTVSDWCNGKKYPRVDKVQMLADYFGILKSDLTEESCVNSSIFSIPGIMPIGQWKSVPLLGTIACGQPILADENIEMYLKVPDGVTADFALRCKGDSMINARIFDGDVVYIRQEANINNGDIVAVLVGDEATLKKLYRYSNRIELRAENPTFPVLEYEGEELDEIRILGKAVAFMSILR